MDVLRRASIALGAVACASVLTAPSWTPHGIAAQVAADLTGRPAVTDHLPSADGVDARSAERATDRTDPDAEEAPASGLPTILVGEDDDESLLRLVAVPAPEPLTTAVRLPDGVDQDSYDAGIRGDLVAAVGDGELTVVPGTSPAPHEAGQTYRVAVEVEGGLPLVAADVAEYVMTVLNDPRGWGHDGSVAFERVDTDADFAVTVADGPLTIELCAPLDVGGVYSCGRGGRAVLNADRFGASIEPYLADGGTLTDYRAYLVNHEVGHLLGYQHVDCPAPGEPAPVMLQQSMGLQGCLPNPWPAQE